jgi:tetratricopeptide (TPR) repeat protein
LAYGAAVFTVTRNLYKRDSTPEVAMPRAIPHGVPTGRSGNTSVLLPGSERITVDDALQMVRAESAGSEPAYGAGSNSNPEELGRVADQHFRQGLFQQAAAEYARALDYAADNVDIYNNLGLTLHHIGRSPEAIGYLQKGIALDASHQRIWLTLGFVQTNMGEVAAARRAFTKAVELDPQSRVGLEAKRLLGDLPE